MGPGPTHLKPRGRPRLQGVPREPAFAHVLPGRPAKRPGRDAGRRPRCSTGRALPGPAGRRPRPRVPRAWRRRRAATPRARGVAGPPERLHAAHPVFWRHCEEAFLTDTLQTDLLRGGLRLPHAQRGAASRARRRRRASAAQARRLLPGRRRCLGNRGPPRTWAPARTAAAGPPACLRLEARRRATAARGRGAVRGAGEGPVGCRCRGSHARGERPGLARCPCGHARAAWSRARTALGRDDGPAVAPRGHPPCAGAVGLCPRGSCPLAGGRQTRAAKQKAGGQAR